MPFELSDSKTEAMRQMKLRLSGLETEDGRMAGVRFQPGPGDVVVATPPKCGTTLCLQIIHSLRTRGDMSFEEINLAMPCLEMGVDYGYADLGAPQVAPPQVYKTHFWRRDCPSGEGVRHVFVVRDPEDAGVSFYHFLGGWFFDPADIPLDAFLEEFVLARGEPPTPMQNASYWHNLASWFPHRKDPNLLWLFYEDIVQDLPAAVALIANFLQLGVDDPQLQALAAEQATIEHMKQHPTKYDEHMLKLARNQACGLPLRAGLDGSAAGKVRAGGAGRGREQLSDGMRAALQRKWDEVVAPCTGYPNYDTLRRGVNAELGR